MREPPTGAAILAWIASMIILLILLLAVHFAERNGALLPL